MECCGSKKSASIKKTNDFNLVQLQFESAHVGPHCELEIGLIRRREVNQYRFTGLDRELVVAVEHGILRLSEDRGPYGRFSRELAFGRLKTLERLGLASAETPDRPRRRDGSGAATPDP